MMFIRSFVFFAGVLATLALGWVGIVGVPDIMIGTLQPAPELKRYTQEQLFGRDIYIREGCLYCHSQQVRAEGYGADQGRFWGRPSVPADYVYDAPHLLGTMRTGPDLFNIAVRQPSEAWHLLHLYNPRLVADGSLMPPFPWLFVEKETPGPGEQPLALPDSVAPKGKVVVPSEEARALVAYLLGLDHTYPVSQVPTLHDTTRTQK
ncbi:MAG: cbb3-type cytochrome c oxidase subunit II [Bacteroidota bacterium]